MFQNSIVLKRKKDETKNNGHNVRIRLYAYRFVAEVKFHLLLMLIKPYEFQVRKTLT